MRILLLAHGFNSLTQRLHVELREAGHDVSVEFDVNDALTREAVALFDPKTIIAPYLRRAIPEDVWRRTPCLVVHPGPEGDRGPSSLDWAVLEGAPRWGVSVLQAEAEMDAGPVWSSESFPMRPASKSSLYRNEATEAAVAAVLTALERIEKGGWVPRRVPGRPRPLLRQAVRKIDWSKDDTDTVLRKIRASDGWPGVLDRVAGREAYLYDARPAQAVSGEPGRLLGRCRGAVCRATSDGAVWIGQLRARDRDGEAGFKLPAAAALGAAAASLPELAGPQDISYEEKGRVGYLAFDFPSGAMGTDECRRLREAWGQARRRPTKVICLMGGRDFWSNGIHLGLIEAAPSPAEESWNNINAMNDLVREIVTTTSHLTVSAVRGNCAAGGCFLAIASDYVAAREGVVLNPHYKNMGNLFGSEYWTYLLPRRMGKDAAAGLMAGRLPIGVREALSARLIDEAWPGPEFAERLEEFAGRLADSSASLLRDKGRRRELDESAKPLEAYRKEELDRMRLNFFGFDPSYHVARYHFIHKTPKSWTPLYLAGHRSSRPKPASNVG